MGISLQNLEEVIIDQNEAFSAKELGIPRDIDLKKHLASKQITVISGVRRSGKSTLLARCARSYKGVYYITFEDERLTGFTVADFRLLMQIFRKNREASVLCIDEVQNIKGWERFVRRIHDEGYKVLVTGSNANLLSRELGTRLTGRYGLIELYPFSFKELLQFHAVPYSQGGSRIHAQVQGYLDQYIQHGGFPEYIAEQDTGYLQRVYEDILYRDLIVRFGIRDVKAFKQLGQYLFTTIGTEISYTALSKTLEIKSPMSVRNYVGFMQEAWLIFEVYKYDFSLKKQFTADKKIYAIDNGLRNVIAFTFSENQGRLLENLVAVELRRRGEEIFYYKGKKECDFLIKKGSKIVQALQVTVSLEAHNKEREIEGLLEALQFSKLKEGTIIVKDGEEEILKYGEHHIHIVSLAQWLLDPQV